MKRASFLTSLLASLMLAGCATPANGDTAPPPSPSSPPVQAVPPAAPLNVEDDTEPSPPAATLTPQTLFQILAAELAGQRGEIGAAWSTYLSLARETGDARLARRATELAANARALEQAAQSAQVWAELAPDSRTAQQALEWLRLAAGHLSDIEPALAERLAQARTQANLDQAYADLQSRLLRSRDRTAAWVLLQRLSEPDLAQPAARMARAAVAAGAEAWSAAYDEAQAALALDPQHEAAAILAARSARRTLANRAAAQPLLEDFLARVPQAHEVRYAYARLLIEDNQLDLARTQLERLLKNTPNHPAVRFSLAQLAWRQQQPQQAQEHLKAVLAMPNPDRDDTPTYLFLAQIAEEQGQLSEAIEWLKQVTAADERLPSALRQAVLLGKLGRIDEARAAASHAPARSLRERALSISTEAMVLRDAGRVTESFDVLQAGLTKHPDQPDLLYDLAMAAERLDRLDETERALRRLIELRPEHAHAFNALGYTLADRNIRLEEAHTLITEALRLAPDDAQIIDSMGWVLFRLKDFPGAVAHLRRAYHLQPDPEIAAHLGEVLWALRQHDEARQIWQEAQAQHPDNAVLRTTLERFRMTR